MNISWSQLATIFITQAISTASMYYVMKFLNTVHSGKQSKEIKELQERVEKLEKHEHS